MRNPWLYTDVCSPAKCTVPTGRPSVPHQVVVWPGGNAVYEPRTDGVLHPGVERAVPAANAVRTLGTASSMAAKVSSTTALEAGRVRFVGGIPRTDGTPGVDREQAERRTVGVRGSALPRAQDPIVAPVQTAAPIAEPGEERAVELQQDLRVVPMPSPSSTTHPILRAGPPR